ncbi:NAD(P)H-binding protein [Chitinophaga sp.]|uniref:NAD(P)H-binding protein n=1 Tax=Chitinophaga sp. TaxID=1869181 RepID=UPI002F93E772
MKITITGSLGNISHPLTQLLTAKGHQVTVVSHNPERAAAILQLNAIPAIGSIEDTDFLLQAFANADAVYTMIPPNYQTADLRGYIKSVGERYADAIARTGVRYVVNLSSIGAHIPDGPGPTSANYYVEQQLNALKDVSVLHLRPGMFYNNFFGSIDMIRHQHMIGNNFDATAPIVMSHPHDIAAAAAAALDTLSFSGKSVQYIASDEKNGAEVATLLGQAIGKPDLAWIGFSDDAMLQGMLQNGLSEQMAKIYVIEIGVALREGTLFEDYRQHEQLAFGERSFADFALEFAGVYNSQHA